VCLTALFIAGTVFAQEPSEAKPDLPLSDKGFFIYWGLGYGYENIEQNSGTIDKRTKITNNGLNGLIGMDYDFGRVSIDLSVDCMLFTRVKYEEYGYSASQIDDVFYAGAGTYIGLKLINSKVFDLTLPLGALFRISKLEVTHDGKKKFFLQLFKCGKRLDGVVSCR